MEATSGKPKSMPNDEKPLVTQYNSTERLDENVITLRLQLAH